MDYQEPCTVLAALRYYQRERLADEPGKRPDSIHKIADDDDNDTSLDGAGIDELRARLNGTIRVATNRISSGKHRR